MKIVNRKTFYKQLAIVIAIAIFFLVSWMNIPKIEPFWLLGLQSLVIFIGFSIYVFEKGLKTAQLTDKNAFIRFIFSTIMIKMFLSVGVVFFYFKNYHPNSRYFLIPFFANYILFTIFETRFSSKIGKLNPLDSKIKNNEE